MQPLSPSSHGESVALFRYGLIAELVMRDLDHGALAAELRRRSEERVRAPDSPHTRTYSVPTLERWLYAFKRGGLPALVPTGRSDRGRGRALCPEVRQLLCDIRREHPDVSVTLMLRTLARGRAHRRRRDRVHRAPHAQRGGPRARAGRRPTGADHAPAVAGRGAQRPVARRRVPRPDAHRGRRAHPGARARAPRRLLALRARAARRVRREGGDHARALRLRGARARAARGALPRQWQHLPRRHPAARVRAARRYALARTAPRRTRARQDGALLAHAARGRARPHRAGRHPRRHRSRAAALARGALPRVPARWPHRPHAARRVRAEHEPAPSARPRQAPRGAHGEEHAARAPGLHHRGRRRRLRDPARLPRRQARRGGHVLRRRRCARARPRRPPRPARRRRPRRQFQAAAGRRGCLPPRAGERSAAVDFDPVRALGAGVAPRLTAHKSRKGGRHE